MKDRLRKRRQSMVIPARYRIKDWRKRPSPYDYMLSLPLLPQEVADAMIARGNSHRMMWQRSGSSLPFYEWLEQQRQAIAKKMLGSTSWGLSGEEKNLMGLEP
jgi:hypothetical protein